MVRSLRDTIEKAVAVITILYVISSLYISIVTKIILIIVTKMI